MDSFKKSIGIIGGAGPLASCFLYEKIIHLCQETFGAKDYSDFPEIFLISHPFVRGDIVSIKNNLSNCFHKLKNAGAEVICLASHSFHAYLIEVKDIVFIHLIEECIREAQNLNVSKALVLSSQLTIQDGIYEDRGIECIYPSFADQEIISKTIRDIASGHVSDTHDIVILQILDKIISERSVDAVLIACTELSILYSRSQVFKDMNISIIDGVEVLARKLISCAKKRPYHTE